MDTPDYANYSLEELYDALEQIDSDTYPGRADELRRHIQIKNQEPIAQSSGAIKKEVIWGKRTKAFLIDFVLASFPIVMLDLFFTYPISSIYFEVLYLLWFIAYFAYFELVKNKPTPGKSFYKLEFKSVNQSKIEKKVIALRLSIFSLPFIISAYLEIYFYAPFVIEAVLNGLLFSLFTYNAIATIFAPLGQTLHDSLSGLYVAKAESTESGTTQCKPWYDWQTVCILAAGVAILIFQITPNDAVNTNKVSHSVQEAISTQYGLRTVVSIESMQAWTLGEDKSSTELKITIWFPISSWNNENIANASKAALDALTLTPGFYDEGTLIVKTGRFFTISESYELTLP